MTNFLKYIFLFFLLFKLSSFSVAQNNIDALLYELNATPNDEQKAAIHKKIGEMYLEKMAFGKAIDHFKEPLKPNLFKYVSSTADKKKLLRLIAYCYEQTNDLKNQIETLHSLLSLVKTLHNSEEEFVTLKGLSNLYFKSKNYNEAINCNNRLLEICPKHDFEEFIIIYNNLGFAFHKLYKDNKSLENFENCFKLFEENESKISDEKKITLLSNMAIMYNQLKNNEKSEELYNKAYKIAEKMQSIYYKGKINNFKAAFWYNSMGQIREPLNLLRINITLLEPHKEDVNCEAELMASYKFISQIYLDQKLYKKHIEANKVYQDLKEKSLHRVIKANQMQLENQFSLEKNESNIKQLIAEKEKKDAELTQTKLIQEKQEKDLKLREKEVLFLKQDQELQMQFLKNKELEKDKLMQKYNIEQEKNFARAQLQKIALLQKDKTLKDLSLNQKKKEIQILKYKDRLNELRIEEEEKVRTYSWLLLLLLIILAISSVWYFYKMNQKNAILAGQYDELFHAQRVIANKNGELKSINDNLEQIVNQRTQFLTNANEQLISANSQLEQFSFILAHNIKGPIARLIGLGYILKQDNENLSPEKQFVMNKIDESVHDLQGVIKDLNIILDIKNGLATQKELIDINQLTSVILKRLEHKTEKSHVNILVNTPENLSIFSVKSYIESIIYNLLSNGVKYKREIDDAFVKIDFEKTNKILTITVEDNGLGIDMKKFGDKLFGLYQRFHTHVTGKGLGMHIVKLQTEFLGGTLQIESKPNIGTKFTITVPVEEA